MGAERSDNRPLLDHLGKLIVEGKDAATYLWQVPDDQGARAKLRELLESIKRESAARGRREMPALCDQLLVALRATPSPQQVDLLQDGFDRLYKMWEAARTGLL